MTRYSQWLDILWTKYNSLIGEYNLKSKKIIVRFSNCSRNLFTLHYYWEEYDSIGQYSRTWTNSLWKPTVQNKKFFWSKKNIFFYICWTCFVTISCKNICSTIFYLISRDTNIVIEIIWYQNKKVIVFFNTTLKMITF